MIARKNSGLLFLILKNLIKVSMLKLEDLKNDAQVRSMESDKIGISTFYVEPEQKVVLFTTINFER